jgi:hypothetical protein
MEDPMNAFVVELKNQPGELARVTAAVAARRVNITGGAGIGWGNSGAFAAWSDDEAGLRAALGDLQCNFREVEVIQASVANEPGSLAKAARKLADAGVTFEFVIPMGMSDGQMTLAMGVDKVAAAREALGDRMAAMA